MTPHAPSFLAPLHRLLADERRRQASDRDLLQAFVQRNDADAFAELLRRHGPMVLRLALHLLHQRQDAEDVLQAAFWTLARKASSLRAESSVAGWLHRVAWRLALRSRAAAARQQVSLSLSPPMEMRDLTDEMSLREARAMLHEELAGLSEHLRSPLVLCYFEGLTRDESARRLGWSLATLKRRLERGRKLLHARLSRRGLTLSAVLSTTLLASTDVSASLVARTLRLAIEAPPLPDAVASLLTPTLLSTKLKSIAALTLLLSALVGASALVYRGQADAPTPSSAPPVAVAEAGPPGDASGDPLPDGAVARLGTVRLRHGERVQAIDFTPDGKRIVSAAADGIRVWDVADGRQVRRFAEGLNASTYSLSPDGRRLALNRLQGGVDDPTEIEMWDVETGKLLSKFRNRFYQRIRFSPDGKRLAALHNNNHPGPDSSAPTFIDFWDAEGRFIYEIKGPAKFVADVRFTTDGKALLLGGFDKSISIVDATNGKELRRIAGLSEDVYQMALSPDGEKIAFVGLWETHNVPGVYAWGPKAQMVVVDLRTGVESWKWNRPKKPKENDSITYGFWGLGWSPDGKRLAACEINGPVRIWDAADGRELRRLAEDRKGTSTLAWSPNGQALAFVDGNQTLRVIDADSGAERVVTTGHRSGITALALTPDGNTAFTASDKGAIRRWDVRTGRELGRLAGHNDRVNALVLSTEGRTLWSRSVDSTVRAWNLKSNESRQIQEKLKDYQGGLIASPDGRLLATPQGDNGLLLMRSSTGESLHRLTNKFDIRHVAFTADSSIIVILDSNRTICRWDTATGSRLPDLRMPPDRDEPPRIEPKNWSNAEKAALSPDGRFLALSYDTKYLRVLDVERQRVLFRTEPRPNRPSILAFAPDGRTLVWGEDTGVIHWLELTTGRERGTFEGHIGAIQCFAFTSDGKRLISGSNDTTALVWDLIGAGPSLRSDTCWRDLADKDAARAYRAMRSLIGTPHKALALLHSRLKAVAAVDEKHVERWIADLDSDAFAVREQATKELAQLGELAETAMRKALAAIPTLETSRRLQTLLDEVTQQSVHPSADVLRQIRSVEVLERIGTPEARSLLETLSGGAAGARLTREAQAAKVRLTARK